MIVYIMDEDTVIDEFYVSPNGYLEPIETPSPAFGRDYSIGWDYSIGSVNGSPTLVLRDQTVKLKGVLHESLEAVYQTREHQNALVETTY